MRKVKAEDRREPRIVFSQSEKRRLTPPEIRYCQNPKCNQQIPPEKWRFRPRYCCRACQLEHLAILRGVCARPGCNNYVKHRGKKYCSLACLEQVRNLPLHLCARPGCQNMTKNTKYCSRECRDMCISLEEMSQKGRQVLKAYREATGHTIKYAERARAASRNNKIAPPKKKMHRETVYLGYIIHFDPEGDHYRAHVPGLPGAIARGKTKREAFNNIKPFVRSAPPRPRQAAK